MERNSDVWSTTISLLEAKSYSFNFTLTGRKSRIRPTLVNWQPELRYQVMWKAATGLKLFWWIRKLCFLICYKTEINLESKMLACAINSPDVSFFFNYPKFISPSLQTNTIGCFKFKFVLDIHVFQMINAKKEIPWLFIAISRLKYLHILSEISSNFLHRLAPKMVELY